MQKNKSKPQIVNQRVSIAEANNCYGRTGIVKSCHDDGTFGVRLDGIEWVSTFKEDELYFPNHKNGYNQPCFH